MISFRHRRNSTLMPYVGQMQAFAKRRTRSHNGHVRPSPQCRHPSHSPSREHRMTVKVQVGPPQIAIHQGQTVLISEEDGQINWPSEKGLYFFDTRVVSSWTIYANGEPWELLNGGAISYYASRVFLTNRSFLTEDGAIAPRMLGLT